MSWWLFLRLRQDDRTNMQCLKKDETKMLFKTKTLYIQNIFSLAIFSKKKKKKKLHKFSFLGCRCQVFKSPYQSFFFLKEHIYAQCFILSPEVLELMLGISLF